MPARDPKDRLIVALDVPRLDDAARLLDHLEGSVTFYKIGTQLFTAAGPTAVELVHKRGGFVFLDLKFHDIPNTVAGAVREAASLGVFMLSVHASGGTPMMKAAAEACRQAPKEFSVTQPLCLAVTVLTSLGRASLQNELNVPLSVEGQVLHLASLAKDAGLDGSVCAPQEVRAVRNALGREWVIVAPGVRPAGADAGDQARVAAPEAAIRAGADYLVVGRPITAASDPKAAATQILEAIARA